MPYSPVTFLSRATLSATVVFSLIGHLNTAYAADRVIVLDSGESELSLIDETTHKVVGTEPTGKEPHHLMITPDGKSLIVADSVSNNLMFIDPHTGQVQRTVEDIEDPYQLGFSPDHKWFVTAALRMDRADIYRYDGTNMTLVKHIPLAKTPSHMTFASDNRTVFMTLQDSGELAAIDLPTQTVLWKMHVGNEPAGLWMTPGDKYLLVGMTGEDDVDDADGALDDGKHVVVSNRVESTISIIDYTTLANVGDITGLMPGPDDMELTPDKRYLWVGFRFAKHVGIIDMSTRKLIETIPVGRSPHGIYFDNRAPVIAPNPD
jgi:YVTN family beta-propeller protein